MVAASMQILTYLLDSFLAAVSVFVCESDNCVSACACVHVGALGEVLRTLLHQSAPHPTPHPCNTSHNVSVTQGRLTVAVISAAVRQHFVQQHKACPTECLPVPTPTNG